VPKKIVARVAAETATIVRQPDIRERIAGLGGEPVGKSPEASAAIQGADLAKWEKLVADAKVTVD
jgi:hypothetical protein